MIKKDLDTTEFIHLAVSPEIVVFDGSKASQIPGAVTGDRQMDILRHRFVKFGENLSSLASKASTDKISICLMAR